MRFSVSTRSDRLTLHAALGAGALAFVALALPLVFGLTYFDRDLGGISVPIYEALRRAIAARAGFLTPYIGNGISLAAAPESHALYPLAWPLLPLSAEGAASWMVPLHLGLGAAFAACLARSFAVRAPLAFGAGVAWALCGPALDLVSHSYYIVSAPWLPLGWWGARLAMRHRTATRGALVFTLAVAMCLLGSEPQSVGTMLGVAALEVAFARARVRGAPRSRGAWPVASATLALGAFAGVCIGLTAWWEQLAEGALLTRSRGVSFAEAALWHVDGAVALATVLPRVMHWGAVGDGSPMLALSPDLATQVPWTIDPYLGPFLLATAALGATRRRAATAVVLAAGTFVLSLGPLAPVFRLAWAYLPVFGKFRYPAKYLVPFALGVIMLASVGAQHALRSAPARRRALAMWAGALALTASAAVALVVAPPGGAALTGDTLRALAIAGAPVVVAAALRERLTATKMALLLAGSLAMVAPEELEVGASVRDIPSILGGVAARAAGRPHLAPVVCVQGDLDRRTLRAIGEQSSAWNKSVASRLWLLPDRQVLEGLSGPIPGGATLRSSLAHRMTAHLGPSDSAAVRALGCEFFIGENAAPPGFVEVSAAEALLHGGAFPQGVAVRPYRVVDPIPPAFIARRAERVPTDDVVSRLLAARSAVEAERVVDDPLARLDATRALPDGEGVEGIEVSWRRRDRARLRMRGHGGAVVGLRTTYLVGWRASQNGAPLAVVRASGAMVAVVIPDVSRGSVSVTYEPVATNRRWGSLAVGLVAAAVVALAGRASRRSMLARKAQSPDPS